jgi:integrase/recombinase XerD
MSKEIMRRSAIKKTLDEVFAEFQLFNARKNLSKQTITFYQWNVMHFLNYVNEKEIKFINQITVETVDQFVLKLKEKYDNSITINTYLRATRVFLYFAMSHEYLSLFKIQLLKQVKKIKETYSDEDIKKLIKKPDIRTCIFTEYRNWVLINYFLETGNRLNTVLNIKVYDVNIKSSMITLRTMKNDEEMIYPLSKSLIGILSDYIKCWGLSDDNYLFPNVNNQQMSTDSIKNSISKYNKDRDVKITSIHAFRHTFAKNYIKTGGNSFKLQLLLNHKDMTMTRQYVALYGEDLAEDFEQHSILQRINPIKSRFKQSDKRLY